MARRARRRGRQRVQGAPADPWAVSDAAIRARLRRLYAGRSLAAIAADLGMNHETVRRQLHGGSAVSLAFVAAAAARNHTSIDWVVWGRSATDGADEDRELRLAHVERRLDRAAAAVRVLARDVARARREHEGRRR